MVLGATEGMLSGPLNAYPWVINGVVEAVVSLRRLGGFLSVPKFDRDAYFTPMSELGSVEDTDVALADATFSPNNVDESAFKLSNVTLQIMKGEFVGVVGRVGSGKSLLLRAMLGELPKESGAIAVSDSFVEMGVGYVQQDAWLQKGTVRDNILFGRAYHPQFYRRVLDACALTEELRRGVIIGGSPTSLAKGDLTQVGENGSPEQSLGLGTHTAVWLWPHRLSG